MPRYKPTKNINKLGRWDVQPLIKYIGEYFASKANEKLYMKPPCSQEEEDFLTFYIHNKFEHAVLESNFNELCENRVLQNKVLSQRIHELKRINAQLRADFLRLNNFLRDSDEKKKASIKKINEEILLEKELRENIEAKRVMVNDFEKFRDELEYTTNQYRLYESVLEDVVEENDSFDSIKDLIIRCDAIMRAQNDITTSNNEVFQGIEKMQKRVLEIAKKAELIILGLKNELTEMERTYNKAAAECLHWEKIMQEADRCRISKDLDNNLLIDGIQVIYRLLCKRSDIETSLRRHEVEKTMDFIKEEVEILRGVIDEYNESHHVPLSTKPTPIC